MKSIDSEETFLDIKFNKSDRIYHPMETVSGVVSIRSPSNNHHNGIKLTVEGTVQLQLSSRSVGLFEAFYAGVTPTHILSLNIDIMQAGSLPTGLAEFPFQFKFRPLEGRHLFETYHGVYVSVQYLITCEVSRSLLSKNEKKTVEFICEILTDPSKINNSSIPFEISPNHLQNIKKSAVSKIPDFKINGKIDSNTFHLSQPLTGELVVHRCSSDIRSIELQLVRVETCAYEEGDIRESTEIQNIQIADGDVCRDIAIPLYMVFPRLFTCSSVATSFFKVEFEINLIALFGDGYLVTENFPITLVR